MRTGAVGNRTAEDMINTLVEPKKRVISRLRDQLLSSGFSEQVEYDSINIEPVLEYSKGNEKTIFVKHKWELVAMVPLTTVKVKERLEVDSKSDLSKYEIQDEEGKNWLKFRLPDEEEVVLRIVQFF